MIEFVIVFCDRICDSGFASTAGSDPLTIVATSLQFHLSSLCADAHRQTLVYIYIYIYTRVLPCASAHGDERWNWSEVDTMKVDTIPQYDHKMLSQILS